MSSLMSWRLGRAVLVAVLAWNFVPGSGEVAEQLVHLLRNGHFAHTIPGDPDEGPSSAEHECQGAVHSCQCCPSTFASSLSAVVVRPEDDPMGRPAGWPSSHADPHLRHVFRPPRA